MKVAQQFVAAGHVGAVYRGLFARHMRLKCLDARRRTFAHKGARHFGLQHAPHGKHLPGLNGRRRRHKGTAGGLQIDESVLRQLVQSLANQCARHTEMVREFLLAKLGTRL